MLRECSLLLASMALLLFPACAADSDEMELATPAEVSDEAQDETPAGPETVALDTSATEPPCPLELSAQPPLPVLTAPDPDAACRSHGRRDLRAAKKALRARYHMRHEDSRLEVDSACDRLEPNIQELVFESSNGHGFSLRLDRLTKRDDGDYDLLRLSFSSRVKREPGYCVSTRVHGRSIDETPTDIDDQWEALGDEGAKVQRAVLPGARVDKTLARMRAELGLEAREIERPVKPDEIRLGGIWGSSRDFHVAYRMTDVNGNAVAADWAGYERSGDQETWLPLDLAADTYNEMIWDEPIEVLLEEVEVDPDARDFFVDRFRAAQGRNEEFGIWYVRERFLAMAQDLGDQRLYADLLQAASLEGEHSETRSRAAAAQALTVLSGWVPTSDGADALTPGEAAAHLVGACTGD